MNFTYLAVEGDDAVHERESKFWRSRNISVIRTLSMTEGIKEAMQKQFLYIGINAANINYQPQLSLLREATNDPIFISTTQYTMQEQGIAVSLGADLFGQISENPQDNYDTVMANIYALNERSKRRKPPVKLLPYANILLAPKRHQIFINDAEIKLTKTDFDLLHYFMLNRGIILTPEQIYNQVWKNERAECIEAVVKSAIARLRKKIGKEDETSLIENIWGVGFRLPSLFER
jgi:DNA-binding response OmpR family regulator